MEPHADYRLHERHDSASCLTRFSYKCNSSLSEVLERVSCAKSNLVNSEHCFTQFCYTACVAGLDAIMVAVINACQWAALTPALAYVDNAVCYGSAQSVSCTAEWSIHPVCTVPTICSIRLLAAPWTKRHISPNLSYLMHRLSRQICRRIISLSHKHPRVSSRLHHHCVFSGEQSLVRSIRMLALCNPTRLEWQLSISKSMPRGGVSIEDSTNGSLSQSKPT